MFLLPFVNVFYRKIGFGEELIGLLCALKPWVSAAAGERGWLMPSGSTALYAAAQPMPPTTTQHSACPNPLPALCSYCSQPGLVTYHPPPPPPASPRFPLPGSLIVSAADASQRHLAILLGVYMVAWLGRSCMAFFTGVGAQLLIALVTEACASPMVRALRGAQPGVSCSGGSVPRTA